MNGYEGLVLDYGNVLKLNCGDDCKTLNLLKVSEFYT